MFAAIAGDNILARPRIEQALELWIDVGDKRAIACCYSNMALVVELAGDAERALELAYTSLERHQSAGHSDLIARRYLDVARLERQASRIDRAIQLHDKAEASIGNDPTWLRGWALLGRAQTTMAQQNAEHGEQAPSAELVDELNEGLEAAVEMFESSGDSRLLSQALRTLGIVAHWVKQYERARTLYESAHATSLAYGDMIATGHVLRELGDLTADEGDVESGVTLVRQSLLLLESIGDAQGIEQTSKKLSQLLEREVNG